MKTNAILITGANGGLGIALMDEFAKNGWDIVAHARKPNLEFKEKIEQISKKYGVNVTPVFFDMCDSVAMKNEIAELIKAKIPINTLVNNAAMEHGGFFNMTKIETIKEVFEINFFAQLELTQLLLRYLGKTQNSSVVNISSIAGINHSAGNCAYGTSKSALIAFTKVLASEYQVHKVRINAVAPGLVDTGMRANITSKAKDKMLENSAMKRMAAPSEIAKVVYFLASDGASFINGEVVKIRGGQNI